LEIGGEKGEPINTPRERRGKECPYRRGGGLGIILPKRWGALPKEKKKRGGGTAFSWARKEKKREKSSRKKKRKKKKWASIEGEEKKKKNAAARRGEHANPFVWKEEKKAGQIICGFVPPRKGGHFSCHPKGRGEVRPGP